MISRPARKRKEYKARHGKTEPHDDRPRLNYLVVHLPGHSSSPPKHARYAAFRGAVLGWPTVSNRNRNRPERGNR